MEAKEESATLPEKTKWSYCDGKVRQSTTKLKTML